MSTLKPVPSIRASGAPRRRRGSQIAPPDAEPASRGRALLETHLSLIQRKLYRLSWRSGLPACDAEEFRSWALFRLVSDNYRILGRWQGRSSFSTFLTVVLVNLMRDYRTHVWGKWRPCAASRRGGKEYVLLEQLLVRDGLTEGEAVERLCTQHGISLAPAELERMASALPRRHERRRVGEEELSKIPIDGQVESRLEEEERARAANRLQELLVPLLQSLPAEDRLLLKLHFFDGLSMAAISRLLRRPQRELYSARDRCLKKIRRALTEAGMGVDQSREIFGGFQETLGLEACLGAS